MTPEPVNSVTIHTKHFIATADTQNGTFVVYGDFTETEIMPLTQERPMEALIEELCSLEIMLRRITGKEDVHDRKESGNERRTDA